MRACVRPSVESIAVIVCKVYALCVHAPCDAVMMAWQADQQSEEEIRRRVVRELGNLKRCTPSDANAEGYIPRCQMTGDLCELCEACDDLFVLMDKNSSGGVDVYELEEGMLEHWQVKFTTDQLISQVASSALSLSLSPSLPPFLTLTRFPSLLFRSLSLTHTHTPDALSRLLSYRAVPTHGFRQQRILVLS